MAQPDQKPEEAQGFSPGYRTYVLLLLLAIYITNYADRQILEILSPQIKAEFGLSNSSLGLLGGVAFAVFYATLGIPIAAWADRGSRKWILIMSATVWSVMTSVCGLAQNFWQMALARVGVGVGEAGGSPPSHSMIADMYPAKSRATALAIYSLGVPFGLFVGNMIGHVGAEHGWRAAFYVLGLPGLFFVLLAVFTLREPRRGHSDGIAQQTSQSQAPGVMGTAKFMWSQKALRHVIIGATLVTLTGYSGVQWTASFLIRSHGMTLSEVATYLALATGIAGGLGTFAGGWLSDRLGRLDIRWNSWIVGLIVLFGVPVGVAVGLVDDSDTVRILVPIATFVGGLYLGPTFAMTQSLVMIRMRAVASGILLFIINFIGLGLGPFITGFLSDALTPTYGADALRYAMMALAVFNIWAAVHFFIAGRSLADNYARAKAA